MTRPIWAEVSQSCLKENFASLTRQAAGRAALLCVVKANAYGHGMEPTARTLATAGAEWLGVTSVEEGAALRDALPDAKVNILVLSGVALCEAGQAEAVALVDHRLTAVVWETAQLRWLEKAAAERGLAAGSLPVHLEIETGMARQGVPWNDAAAIDAIARYFSAGSALRLAGVMTHYASPERADDPMNARQTARFAEALETLRRTGVEFEVVHAGNSDTLFDAHQMHELHALAAAHNAGLMIRPGIALYGGGARSAERGLAPVLSWKTRVISVRTLEIGDTVGYGSIFIAARPTQIALVAVGYADGLNRGLSNLGAMLVRGHWARIVGRISMDLSTIDVTDIPGVMPGDEVVIIGAQGRNQITAGEIAALTETISYEVLCGIALRVPRVVVEHPAPGLKPLFYR
jgi:alanine racemase